jgi:hypothetical protein
MVLRKRFFRASVKRLARGFCGAPMLSSVQDAHESKAQLQALQIQHKFFQRDLRRKEKALAVAAALLVPQKIQTHSSDYVQGNSCAAP